MKSLLNKALQTKKKTNLTEIYQFRMSREMKIKIFDLLKKKDLDLAHVIRQYLQSILEEEENQ